MTKTTFAAGQLRSIVDRILRLKSEQDELSADIREVYKEAHANGFDKTVLGLVVQRLRKEEKDGAARLAETDSVLDLYLTAYRGDVWEDEGNHPSETPKAAQRSPEPRETASSENPRTRMREEGTNPAADEAGPGADAGTEEATAMAGPVPDVPHDPDTGEITEGGGDPAPSGARAPRPAEPDESHSAARMTSIIERAATQVFPNAKLTREGGTLVVNVNAEDLEIPAYLDRRRRAGAAP